MDLYQPMLRGNFNNFSNVIIIEFVLLYFWNLDSNKKFSILKFEKKEKIPTNFSLFNLKLFILNFREKILKIFFGKQSSILINKKEAYQNSGIICLIDNAIN